MLPCASVMVIMVLLNEAFTSPPTPETMFLRSRRVRSRVVFLRPCVDLSFWRAPP